MAQVIAARPSWHMEVAMRCARGTGVVLGQTAGHIGCEADIEMWFAVGVPREIERLSPRLRLLPPLDQALPLAPGARLWPSFCRRRCRRRTSRSRTPHE